ncbi:MAG: 2-C-methyl-D-erythritol 4-phosphate cytidylyltransferase [Bacteroidales bacterium]|jgi:2-C-methyl-D-erythritol 4-phosphate cytidylyltransferase|nr:2-C-methyl-D-erythritol 4-phosphate cytidylyltransferase [Bacteroidales bacterium]MCI1784944.1 2-C-methyl-D-erythritol 4-phosphate cytidylyltransferase [Bacteroidales bacterium]
MGRKIFLIAMAAGRGTRMGGPLPKQFMKIGGEPILRRSIEKFIKACPDVTVVTVLPKEYIPSWKNYCYTSGFSYPQIIVQGGITRFHSVKNALAKIPDGAIVAIHDGVRPLVSCGMIKNMVLEMDECRALIPVIPVVDTVKVLNTCSDETGRKKLVTANGESADRSRLYCSQTPQMFYSEDIKAAYSSAYDITFTDDASVAQKNNIILSYIIGEKYNIKITTREDLLMAEALLQHTVD